MNTTNSLSNTSLLYNRGGYSIKNDSVAISANRFQMLKSALIKLMLVMAIVVGGKVAWGADETLSCSAGTISDNTMTFNTANFNFVHAKGTGSNFAAYSPWRVYSNNTVTITAGSGVSSITKIEIVHNSTYYGTITSTSGTVTMATSSGGTTSITSCSGTSITLKNTANSQSRWSSIKVYYTASGASTYTVTYDANGGTGYVPVDPNSPYNSGATVTVLDNIGTPISLSKSGYTFGGWHDGNGTDYSAGDQFTISSNIILYASWVQTYNVTYDANGGSGTMNDINSPYASGATVTAKTNEFTYAGKAFVGWNAQANGNGAKYAEGANFTITGNKTLYAQWVSVECPYHKFSTDGYENGETVTGAITISPSATITFSKASGTNVPKYYDNGAAVRTYSNNTFTVSATSSNTYITSIHLIFAYGEDSNTITPNTGTYSNGLWTGDASSVIFSVGESTGHHRRILGIEVCTSSYTITAQSNNNSYGTVSLSGTTITATPADCYRIASPAYTVTPDNAATVSQNDYEFTVTPSSNCTVQINFEEISQYNVSFSTGSDYIAAPLDMRETSCGAGVILPTVTPCRAKYSFVGWSETRISSPSDNTGTCYPPNSTYYPTSDCSLYAVYMYDDDNVYDLIGVDDIVSGGNCIIHAEGDLEYALGNTINGSHRVSPVEMASLGNYDDGWYIETTNTDVIWRIYGNSTDGYCLYNPSISKYLNMAIISDHTELVLEDNPQLYSITHPDPVYSVVEIRAKNVDSYNYLSYYEDGGYFNAFRASSTDIYLYYNSATYTSSPECDCTDAILSTDNATYRIGSGTLDLLDYFSSENTATAEFTCTPSDATITEGHLFSTNTFGVYTINVHQNGDGTYCSTDATFTVTANVYYTVQWYANGTQIETQTYANGNNLVVPSYNFTGEECDDKVFVGWSETEFEETNTPSATIIAHDDFGDIAVTCNKNYYAVFANRGDLENIYSFSGGSKSGLGDGVETSGLGNDYADSHAPYQVKFDNTGDYIVIPCSSTPESLTFGVKMIGGSSSSRFTIQESTDRENYSDVQSFTVSGAQNDIKTFTTTNEFSLGTRYVKIYYTKGSNVGVGPINIKGYTYSAYTTFCPCAYGIDEISDGDLVWAGKNANADWNSTINWTRYNEGGYHLTATAPTSSNNVYIIEKAECEIDALPHINENTTCNNLTMFNGLNIDIAENKTLTINGTATFTNGVINGNVIFGSSATVSGVSTSSHVDGIVTKSGAANGFTFPTGSNGNLGKVVVTDGTATNVSVQYFSNPAGFSTNDLPRWWNAADMSGENPFNHVSNVEYWKISSNEAITADFVAEASTDMHFNSETAEEDRIPANIQMAFYDNNRWTNVGGSASISDNTLTITGAEIPASATRGISGNYTTFGSKSKSTVLPIELVSFTANCNGRSALIEWTTATEKNNDFFVLERSHDAVNFKEIARIAGAGNSIEPISYAYTDFGVRNGDNYYRLVQVDYDGTSTASEIIVANCLGTDGEPEVLACPNPFGDDITLRFENFGNIQATVEVYDMLGRMVHTQKINCSQNDYEVVLRLAGLSDGTYNVRISAKEFVLNKKVVKQ